MDSDGTVYWTKVGNGILHSQQGIQVTIVKGSIINQQVKIATSPGSQGYKVMLVSVWLSVFVQDYSLTKTDF